MAGVKPSGIVTLLSDFGTQDAYVGAMKGVILRQNPRANLVDITHDVHPFAVLQGAFLLDSTWSAFPAGTVHLAVVDPG
ncbi:MAG TPA: SAM-dependent chlorinase/fluorinase, partial [Candidatus Eisenbacteria bacterium]|nr:SAM-dependent chlorinase/fluorinase [Candidatus Eisenbacteria bacterium]